MSIEIQSLRALKDNYIWLIKNSANNQAICVDPGDAQPVLDIIKKENIDLCAILITHHHWDHTAGLDELTRDNNIIIYGPKKSNNNKYTYNLSDGDIISFDKLNLNFTIMETPGHTLDHICYFSPSILLSGDTLFSGGCGRVFEGNAEQMLASLSRLAALPPETRLYCAHEYTEANLQFALHLEPHNSVLIERYAEVKNLRKHSKNTLPSTIALEKETNPFLRCHLSSIQKAASAYCHKKIDDPIATFAVIRAWKNEFL
jgi:hydroxyacylglutathione hydrolase